MPDLSALPKDWVVTSGQFTRKAYTNVYPAVDPTKIGAPLRGKVVVVTGASKGIGARGIVPAFAQAGVKALVLIATNIAKLETVGEDARKIEQDIEVLALSVDISSREQVEKAWEKINARYPKVDLLINNAGIESTDSDKTHELDPDVFFRNFVRRSP